MKPSISNNLKRFWNADSKAEAVRHFNSMSLRWKILYRPLLEGPYNEQ